MELDGFVNASALLKGGVYVLLFKGKVIYIGKSKCMLTRVYAHKSLHKRRPGSDVPKWLPVKGIEYDEILVRPCALSDVDRLEQEMIKLYKPRYNVMHVGHKVSMPITLRRGNVEIVLNRRTPAPSKHPIIERRL